MSNMPHIKFDQVRKDFLLQGDRTFKEFIPSLLAGQSWAQRLKVLKGIDLEIKPGETVGIVGKNGAGKSTMMKLIAGVTYPSQGQVKVQGRVAPLIELEAGFHYELNGYENIYLNGAILGMYRPEIEAEIKNIIAFSELKDKFLRTPLKRYSTGMVMRLAFSIAVHARAQIFLIDEVLAVGDADFQDKCLVKMQELKKQQDKIVIFVSHDERAVTKFCDRALLLRQGKIELDSTPQKVIAKYRKSSD